MILISGVESIIRRSILLLLALSRISIATPTFSDVTVASGLTHNQSDLTDRPELRSMPQTAMSGGAAAVDYDDDGWIDLYFTRLTGSDLLYRNQGDGTFLDVTSSVFGEDHLADVLTNGCAWADIDNDGDQDLYVTSLISNRYHLFINNGVGGFTEEALLRNAAVEGPDLHYGFSVSFGDYDNDGYLDIHVNEWRSDSQNPTAATPNTRLLRNLGEASPGYFEDVTESAGVVMDLGNVAHETGALAFTSRFIDMDGDGLQDLLVASDGMTSRLFWNNGDGTFTDGTESAQVGTDEFGMGSTIGDFDGDGDLDWFVTSILGNEAWPFGTGNRLYRNDGNRVFSDATTSAGVRNGGWGWGTSFVDFDNDTDLDLFAVNGLRFYGADLTRFWVNSGDGTFTLDSGKSSGIVDALEATGFLCFDFDNDGDLDPLVINFENQPILYRNEVGQENSWLKIKTVGIRSNREGIGAEVRIRVNQEDPVLLRYVDGGSNFLSQNERLVHFGLGSPSINTVAHIEIKWPSGVVQTLGDVTANQTLTVIEPIEHPIQFTSITRGENNQITLTWEGGEGGNCRIEYSDDLILWKPIATVLETAPSTTWITPNPQPGSRRFYRGWR